MVAFSAPARSQPTQRRSRVSRTTVALAAGLLATAGYKSVQNWVGYRAPPSLKGTQATRSAGRVRLYAADGEIVRDSEGRKIKTPPAFDASDPEQVISTMSAEYKKRPFGVLAYAPSQNGKGAMIWQMKEVSRYPGDPQGQAFVAGVKTKMAVKTVGDKDVTQMDFWDIMNLMDDKILDNAAGNLQSGVNKGPNNFDPVELPLKVEYVELKLPEEEEIGEEDQGSRVDRSDPRYADLPGDATLVEYKIPKLPDSWDGEYIDELREHVKTLPEPEGYTWLRYTGGANIDKKFMEELIAGFKEGKLLPMKDVYQMGIDVFDLLKTQKSLGRVKIPDGKKVTVVGDVHGQLWDFDHMLNLAGFPGPDNTFVFNGDFVDRGPWSVEVMTSILAFKLQHPDHVFMNRGNHESEMANTFYGFFGEVTVKYEAKMCGMFVDLFRATPLAHTINDEVFVVHGGIPGPDPRVWWKGINNEVGFDGRTLQITLDEIENVNRFMEPDPAENPLMVDLLWSDPKGKPGYGPSGRMSKGIYLFGPDISQQFMESNGLKMTIRSHEVKSAGYRYDHEGMFPVLTIFSAPNYVDKAGNRAAVAVMTADGGSLSKPEFIQYDAQPHPDVPSGAYAAGGPLHPESADPNVHSPVTA